MMRTNCGDRTTVFIRFFKVYLPVGFSVFLVYPKTIVSSENHGKKKKHRRKAMLFLVREAGLEPARPE